MTVERKLRKGKEKGEMGKQGECERKKRTEERGMMKVTGDRVKGRV